MAEVLPRSGSGLPVCPCLPFLLALPCPCGAVSLGSALETKPSRYNGNRLLLELCLSPLAVRLSHSDRFPGIYRRLSQAECGGRGRSHLFADLRGGDDS